MDYKKREEGGLGIFPDEVIDEARNIKNFGFQSFNNSKDNFQARGGEAVFTFIHVNKFELFGS